MTTEPFNPRELTLVVGLGNPGTAYARTFHNVGWQALDALAGGIPFRKPAGKPFSFAKLPRGIVLVKPLTFMNESGRAVAAAAKYFRVPLRTPTAILIVHDDADLEAGIWKLQRERGAAGHNGVRSVIETLGTDAFWRVRIGIRRTSSLTGAPRPKADTFVLKKIPRTLEKTFTRVFEDIGELLGS